jgi:hypothetical protein
MALRSVVKIQLPNPTEMFVSIGDEYCNFDANSVTLVTIRCQLKLLVCGKQIIGVHVRESLFKHC